MSKEILYTTALNNRGNLVRIYEAVKGSAYYCPLCNGKFILKKSGNTGKGAKRPHFAHNKLTPNCTAESVLHYSFKKKLCDLLDNHISEKKELKIRWNCPACSEQHEGNLLAKTTSIREEYNLEMCQPDIALLDADNNVIAAIEIVVTHSPEDKVLQFYRDNGIIFIQIDLSSDEDLKNVEKLIYTPSIVDYCNSPNCSNKKRYSTDRRIVTYSDKCGRCFALIERYAIVVNSAFGIQQTLDFTEDEINIVKSNRNNIKINTNPSTNENYPISICINCKRLRSRYGGSRRL